MRASSIASLLLVTALMGALGTPFTATSVAAPATKANDQGRKVTQRVDQLLRTVIKSQDGSAVAVQLTPTARASQGYFSDIRVSGGAAKLKSLFVSEFDLHAKNVQVDVPSLWSESKIRTNKSQTSLRVVITEQDLTRMLGAGKHTKDMQLKVKYVGDKMKITGQLNFPFLNGPIAGTGKLRQTSDHNVYLDILSLQLRGIEAPGFVKNQLASHINPVVKYANVPFSPPFRSLKVVGNKAILST